MRSTESWTIRHRLLAGFATLFLMASVGVAVALSAARTAAEATEAVAAQADGARRMARVAGQLREFYIHQAHLALGLHHDHHLERTRAARTELGKALVALEGTSQAASLAWLRPAVKRLDTLLDERFLPAIAAGDLPRAVHIHHAAVDEVDAATRRLEKELNALGVATAKARATAAEAADVGFWRAAVALGLTALLAFAVAWVTGRRIAAPVERLRSAAAELVAEQASAVPVEGPSEVAALGVALNEMLAALDAQRAARSRDEAMAVLGRVSAGVAHEINNPLGVILGHAKLIERGDGGVEDAATIVREATATQDIVQAMLDYARPGPMRAQTVELTPLLESLGERYGAAQRLESGAVVQGDPTRLRQLFVNLLENATAHGDNVRVEATTDGACVVVRVADSGPGIPADQVDEIFEPFRSTRPGGVGLGLPIARSIAVAHGGTVSALPGPGGNFVVVLPRAPQA